MSMTQGPVGAPRKTTFFRWFFVVCPPCPGLPGQGGLFGMKPGEGVELGAACD